jgi:hypothetical protein
VSALELEAVPLPVLRRPRRGQPGLDVRPTTIRRTRVMPINRPLGLGEVVRYFIHRA